MKAYPSIDFTVDPLTVKRAMDYIRDTKKDNGFKNRTPITFKELK